MKLTNERNICIHTRYIKCKKKVRTFATSYDGLAIFQIFIQPIAKPSTNICFRIIPQFVYVDTNKSKSILFLCKYKLLSIILTLCV